METLAISFAPFCQYLSEKRLNTVGPFYLVSMPREVKDPTQGVNLQPVVNSIFYLVNNVYIIDGCVESQSWTKMSERIRGIMKDYTGIM